MTFPCFFLWFSCSFPVNFFGISVDLVNFLIFSINFSNDFQKTLPDIVLCHSFSRKPYSKSVFGFTHTHYIFGFKHVGNILMLRVVGGTPTTGITPKFCADSRYGCQQWSYGDPFGDKLARIRVIWDSEPTSHTLGIHVPPGGICQIPSF